MCIRDRTYVFRREPFEKSVCPEILQDALTTSKLSQELETLLFQKKIREDMSQEFEKISELLGTKSSPDIIAERILEVNHLHQVSD